MTELVTVGASLVGDAPLDADQCRAACANVGGGEVVTCVRQSSDSVFCVSHPAPCEGRRPHGLKDPTVRSKSGLRRHLAEAAWLEAASVDAFRRLRRELEAIGAPRRLLRAASRSGRDERRHARTARALARGYGASVPEVECAPFERRSLFDLALENAVEGCVRETWGALVAFYQAEHARDLGVRAAMAGIAKDEMRHAELAWRIERWLSPRLTREHRERLGDARRGAVAQLKNELAEELELPERERLGLPGAHEAHVMLTELDRALRMSAG